MVWQRHGRSPRPRKGTSGFESPSLRQVVKFASEVSHGRMKCVWVGEETVMKKVLENNVNVVATVNNRRNERLFPGPVI